MRGFLTMAVLLLLVPACGDDGVNDGDGDEGGSADAGMTADPDVGTWTEIWEDIIVGTGCNGGALCHAGDVGMLLLVDKHEAYAAFVGEPAQGTNLLPGGEDCVDSGLTRVVPGDPDASLLMMKLESNQPCGDPMPPSGMLSDEQRVLVRTWIANGARDD